MSNILWKSFNLCFSKFKCLPTVTFSSPPPTTDEEDHQDHNQTLFDVHNPSSSSSQAFKNFNSLYDVNFSDSTSTSKSLTTTTTTDDFFSESDSEYLLPDFISAFASHRFFYSSPGSSNSIFESTMEAPLMQDGVLLHKDNSGEVVGGGVAVQTYSPDPYADFRRSMQEMIEARELTKGVGADWEFLHELLLCYLTLNPKHTHKFIVGAFADVTISLVSRSDSQTCRKMHRQLQCAASSLPV